jgi:hypothetical protein
MESSPPKYSPLHQVHNGSSEKLLDESIEEEESPEPVPRWSIRRFLPWFAPACLLFVNIFIFLMQLMSKPGPPTVAACLELTEVYCRIEI